MAARRATIRTTPSASVSSVADGVKPNVFLSGRNLPLAHVMPFSDVSTYHILWSDVVLVESPSYVGALGVFRAYECDVEHVAMDDEGLVPDALEDAREDHADRGENEDLNQLTAVVH